MSTGNNSGRRTIVVHDESDPTHASCRIITLNRPKKRNALDVETMDALIDAISTAADRSVMIVAVPPAFCAGLDLRAILAAGSPETHLRKLVALLVALSHHPQPTICYVRGAVRAGGVALACCADHVAAHRGATFMMPGEPFYKPMALILSPILAARRDLPLASADTLPGQLLSAEAAKSLGIIDDVSEDQAKIAASFARSLDGAHRVQRTRRAQRSITPVVIDETNARLDRAVAPDTVAPLIEHLRERFGLSP